jgi:S1-C subfamily serine protease
MAQGLQIADIFGQGALLLHIHSQSYLGIDVVDVDQERAQALHLRPARGAEITILDHDAPAAKAGLKLHDVITQINGKAIATAEDVKRILHDTSPGRKLQVQVSRDGTPQSVTVQTTDRRKLQEEARQQLGSMGSGGAPGLGFLSGSDSGNAMSSAHPFLPGSSLHVGAMVEPLTPQMADFLEVANGIVIKSVARRSAAESAGLKAHDVILEIGGEPVATTSDWERLLRSSDGRPVQVEILRDRMKQLVLLQVTGKRQKN